MDEYSGTLFADAGRKVNELLAVRSVNVGGRA